jgi:hypothetical protein
MMALIVRGALPRPDRVVIADTSRESSLTWRYTERWTRPMMRSVGLDLEIAPHSLAKRDLYSGNGDILLPVFFPGGKLPTFCSSEWKKLVIRRYLRLQGFGPDRPVRMWFGMSTDEFRRMAVSDKKWTENYYPLIFDVQTSRAECLEIIDAFGIPRPPKTACWMCPNRTDAEWIMQQEQAPEDHERAIALEREIREREPSLYLHDSRRPLAEVVFNPNRGRKDKGSDECANYCWT